LLTGIVFATQGAAPLQVRFALRPECTVRIMRLGCPGVLEPAELSGRLKKACGIKPEILSDSFRKGALEGVVFVSEILGSKKACPWLLQLRLPRLPVSCLKEILREEASAIGFSVSEQGRLQGALLSGSGSQVGFAVRSGRILFFGSGCASVPRLGNFTPPELKPGASASFVIGPVGSCGRWIRLDYDGVLLKTSLDRGKNFAAFPLPSVFFESAVFSAIRILAAFSDRSALHRGICDRHLLELGSSLVEYARGHGGVIPGGGPSGLRGLQILSETFAWKLPAEIFNCPLSGCAFPKRLPNGVLRITHRSSSYRLRSSALRLPELKRDVLLLYEARSFDGRGRWTLWGDLKARWIEEKEFRKLIRHQLPQGAGGPRSRADTRCKVVEALERISPVVLPEEMRAQAQQMIERKLSSELRAVNKRSTDAWRRIKSRRDWELFRDQKLKLLKNAIGPFPRRVVAKELRVTGKISGDGYRIENIIFQSRPGFWVTANLYLPSAPFESAPGILICHSHHTPKEHGEIQDMGMTWARRGCVVLVPELLGHGERRQHPFSSKDDYPKPFRVGRQDYYFRYDMGVQLQIAGQSLMGWFVWDLWRSVDVLLSQKGVDPERIILLGAVAGGGDVAAVAGALDRRIKAVVPFNFGGPEPEDVYPLPEDAELRFNYAGYGSFESTRNLRRSAADGFLPWVIVGSIAPRRLIYAHEFAWDRKRDPVWKRFERIWGEFYGARENLAAVWGRGSVRGRPPESTHCTHIGAFHRRLIHPVFERWFGISVGPKDEYSRRVDPSKLRCGLDQLAGRLALHKLCDLLRRLADRQIASVRKELSGLPRNERRKVLCRRWAAVLGSPEPADRPKLRLRTVENPQGGALRVERLVLEVEPGILVPVLLLLPRACRTEARVPVVCAFGHFGKEDFLKRRRAEVAELLCGGVAVCLPDLRGLGETKPRGSRELWGAQTDQASTMLMLGRTMVGSRLKDLRAVLAYLRSRGDIEAERIALWGDSFKEPNPPARNFRVPRLIDGRPAWSEPLGGLLAFLGALFEKGICAVYTRRGLLEFKSVLSEPFVYIPCDVVIPGVIGTGDLPLLASALAPIPLRMDEVVDEFNRFCSAERVREAYLPASKSYAAAGFGKNFSIHSREISPVRWLLEKLKGTP